MDMGFCGGCSFTDIPWAVIQILRSGFEEKGLRKRVEEEILGIDLRNRPSG